MKTRPREHIGKPTLFFSLSFIYTIFVPHCLIVCVQFRIPKKLAHTIVYTFRRLVWKIMVSLVVDVSNIDPDLEWKAQDTTLNSRYKSNLDDDIVSNPVRNHNNMKNLTSMFMKLVKRIICI